MLDLYNNKYDRETLKSNIYAVKLIDILKTQIIDATFAVRYILNSNYQHQDIDLKINAKTVLKYQPHITKTELYKAIQDYESDDDSIEDFESYCNRNL
jgi:hypothetical protein